MRATQYDGRGHALETESAGGNQAASFLLLLYLLNYEWSKQREVVSPAVQCSFPESGSQKHYARGHRAVKCE